MVEMAEAFIGLMIIVIILAVMIPITNTLLPSMIDTMGAQTGLMVEISILAIVVGGFFVFIRTMLYGESHANIQQGEIY